MSRTNGLPLLQAEDVELPRAVPVAQRGLHLGLIYEGNDGSSDWRAGRRDRRVIEQALAHHKDSAKQDDAGGFLLQTPYMQGLRANCMEAYAFERRDTHALQSAIRDQAVALLEQKRQLLDSVERGAQRASQIESRQLSPEPTTASEAHQSDHQLLRRRESERASELAGQQAQVSGSRSQISMIDQRLAQLHEAFYSQERYYWFRVEALKAFFERRQARYLRSAMGRKDRAGVPTPALPPMPVPEWTSDLTFPAPLDPASPTDANQTMGGEPR